MSSIWAGQADLAGDLLVDHAVDGLGAHVGAHRQHPLQRLDHRGLLARGQQVGEVLHRNAQAADIGHAVARRKSCPRWPHC
jgi:hypothetical protein